MSHIIIEGTIGRKGMRPQRSMTVRKRNGQDVEVPFMRFGMWVQDLTKPPQDDGNGGKRRVRSPYQVVLPENERGEKLFSYMEPDRRILVIGRLTHQPNTGTNRETGETIVYPNPKVYADRIVFLGASAERKAERIMSLLVGKEVVDQETADQCVAAVREHYEALKADNGDVPQESEPVDEEPKEGEEDPF